MSDQRRTTAGDGTVTLTDSAVRGSFWLSGQWLLNKMVTAAATLVIVYFLSPDIYGIAVTALAVGAYVRIAPPDVLGQVLIAHTRHIELFAGAARRLTWVIGVAGTIITIGAIPIVLRVYSSYPQAQLAGLLVALSFFPLCSAAAVVPMTNLQRALEFRRIAVVEGTLQLGATMLSVGMAAVGAGAACLVAPQVVREGARAIWYRRADAGTRSRRFHGRVARVLIRGYIVAAAGEYIHGSLVGLEIVVLGLVAGEYETGLFGFGFMLAVQVSRVLTARIGMVLQSTFAKLGEDRGRQVDGLLRAQRILGSVCVPFALLQVVIAGPLFELLLPAKWAPAVSVFQVLSLGQAFYFASGPSIAGLKAQRRFGVMCVWQGLQTVVAIPIFWLSAGHGAVAMAVASGAMWLVSAPVGTWLCVRGDDSGKMRRTLGVLLRPWLVSGPLFGAGYVVVRWLGEQGTIGDIASVALVGPTLVLAALAVSWWTDVEFRRVGRRAVRWIVESVGTRRVARR